MQYQDDIPALSVKRVDADRGQLPPLPPEQIYEAYQLLEESPARAGKQIDEARAEIESRLQDVLAHMKEVVAEVTAAIEK